MKKSTTKTTKDTNTKKFDADALDIACGANTLAFSTRRSIGEWTTNDGKAIGFYVYDNNPFHEPELREGNYAILTMAMAARGCQVVGRAHYPETGEEMGYTLAVIFVSATREGAQDDLAAARELMAQWPGDGSQLVPVSGDRTARIAG